jgi:hypothetical protein
LVETAVDDVTRDSRRGKRPGATSEEHDGGIFAPDLRERLDADMKNFGECFDAAVSSRDAVSVEHLREATDLLMRSLGRVLIELARTDVSS